MTPPFTLGQTLYVKYSRRYLPGDLTAVEITKIGRKWITLSDGRRFDVADPKMRLDGEGYDSPGRCYLTTEEYEAERALSTAWAKLHQALHDKYDRPAGVTLADVQAAARALHVELTGPGAQDARREEVR